MTWHDAEFADQFDRFLDSQALAPTHSHNGSPPPDHELGETVRRLRAYDDAPGADPAFANRLLENLLGRSASGDDVDSILRESHTMPDVTRPVAAPQQRAPRAMPQWVLVQAATAALLILAVVAGLFASNASWRWQAQRHLFPAVVPIAQSEGGTTETVIDTRVDALPAGHAQIKSWAMQFGPGNGYEAQGLVGVLLFRVERGTMRFTLSDGEHVVSAGETLQAVTEGVYGVHNIGAETAEFIEVDLFDAVATTTQAGPNIDPSDGQSIPLVQAATTLPTRSGQVALEKVAIPPDEAMPPYAATAMDWIAVADGRVGIRLEGERLPFRWEEGEERTFGAGQQTPIFAPGTAVTLRNAGDAPLVLYRLTIVPTSTGAEGEATPT